MFPAWARLAGWLLFTLLVASAVIGSADTVGHSPLVNTARLGLFTILGAVPVGTLLAVALIRTELPGRDIWRWVLGGLLFVPLVVQATAWTSLLGRGSEWLFGATPPSGTWLNGWATATLIHSAAAIPWVVLIVGTGLRLSDPTLEEAAMLESSIWDTLRRVVLPQLGAYATVAACWVAIMAGSEIVVTDLFQIRTAAEEVYLSLALGDSPQAIVRHVGPGVLLQMSLAIAGLSWLAWTGQRHVEPASRPPLTYSLGRWRWLAALASGVSVAILAGVPLVALVLKAGLVVVHNTESPQRIWSLGHFVKTMVTSGWRFRAEFWGTLQVAGVAATVSLIFGMILAWLARGRRARARRVRGRRLGQLAAGAMIAVGLAFPGPLVAYCLIGLFQSSTSAWLAFFYDETLLAPWLAIGIRALPVTTLLLVQAFRTIPNELLESAQLDGLGAASRFMRIVLPLRWRAVVAAWLAALAVGAGDLSASILVLPPSVTTVTTRIFGLLHAGVDDQLAGLSLWATVGMVLLAWTLRLAIRRRSPVRSTTAAIIRS